MKKTAITALKIAVSVGLYAYIFTKIDVAHLWSILREADISYFAAGVGVYFFIQGISAYRWYLLLKPLGLKASYFKLLSFYLLGMFFNNFMPTGIGGDVFRIYYLNKETRTLSRATASVFFDRNLGMAALLLMATLISTIDGTTFKGVPLAPVFGLVGLVFGLANLALFYRPTYNLLHRLLMLFKMKQADERVQHLYDSVNSYRGQWRLIVLALVLSVIVQYGCVVVNKLSANSMPASQVEIHSIGWLSYLVFIPAIGLISMVPVSVNGMGWREFSYIVLFGSVGATEPQAAALAFMWLGVLVFTSIPGAIIYILRGSPEKDRIVPGGETIESKTGVETSLSPAQGEEPVRTV
ncbi:MAG TPA: lysylphosphatidylglycerol synthase transmembrane domain-containing protein [Blastocatellia bacterium]|nr:lysylphosphatidylglycerol synthase transmembrane domain-containing protein [Blastocatellia bacterium]